MFRAAFSLFAAVMVLFAHVSAASAERRVALVIGNSDYKHTSPLRNPRNDASDLSVVLARMGFEVIDGTDLSKRDMERRIRDFSNALEGADVGLFFYAGHGLQVSGKNYLAPVDAELKSESDLDFEAVELNLVLRQMERHTPVSLVFLDACRDNPLASVLARSMSNKGRSVAIGRGLARVEKAVGMMIAFATQPGNIALDGDGRNSPFTSALLEHISAPGASINDVMINVRNSVLEATDGKQVPWENSSLTGQFYFKPAVANSDDRPSGAQQTVALAQPRATETDIDLAFWNSIRESENPALFEEYLRRFPDGSFTPIAKAKLNATRKIDVEAADAEAAADQAKVQTLKTAELTKTAAASDVQAPKQTDSKPAVDTEAAKIQIARDVQTALKRIGCYTSSIDGIWGRGSVAALQRFNRTAKLSLPTGAPDQATLDVIQGWKGKRCTVVATTRKKPARTVTRKAAPRKKATTRKKTVARKPPPRQNPRPQPQQRDSGPNTGVIIGGGGRGGLSIGIIGGGIRF